METSVFAYLRNLIKVNDHLCHLYYNDTECLEIAANFFTHGITNNEICVYISDKPASKELLDRVKGLCYSNEYSRELIEEVNISRTLMQANKAELLVSDIKTKIDKVLRKSTKPLRILMMHCESGYHLGDAEKLLKNAYLNKMSRDMPIVLMNQFNVDRLTSRDLISIFKTHPLIIENGSVHKSPFYQAPDVLIKDSIREYDKLGSLSGKEKKILFMITNGLSNSRIANESSISIKTVETHRANIMKKLDIHNLVDLVKYTMRNGFS